MLAQHVIRPVFSAATYMITSTTELIDGFFRDSPEGNNRIMFRLPRHGTLPTRRKQRHPKLLHPMSPIRLLAIQPSSLIPLRRKSATTNLASPTWSLLESLSQASMVSWTLKAHSYARTWKRSFSSKSGFRECQITHMQKTFLKKEMTTKGSMSQPVDRVGLGRTVFDLRSVAPSISSMMIPVEKL